MIISFFFFFSLRANIPGADTVKRGASPITLTSSLSNTKLKESNSSYSIKASNNPSSDSKESYTLDRGKCSSNSVKNVLFAPGVEKSSSAYMMHEQLSSNFNHLSNSIIPTTSTSQMIKQTLSPLVHHRPLPPTSTTSLSNSKNGTNYVSSSFASYNGTSGGVSSTITNGSKNNFSLSSLSNDNASTHIIPSQRTSSPSRSLSSNTNSISNSNPNTNTIPSHVGRYQFESNYSLKNAKPKNYTSPGNATFYNALVSSSSPPNATTATAVTMINQTSTTGVPLPSSNIPNSNSHIYGTLPKSSVVSAVASEFEQLIARNASGTNHSIGGAIASNAATNNHGNYNTLGSYRVQYSSTNPFLNHFSETSTSDDK